MKLLRNPEIRRTLILHVIVTAVLVVIEIIIDIPTVLLLLMAGMLFTLMHLLYTKSRYQAIAELSSIIDRILHGQEHVLITGNTEGELSILRSEIQKMIVRLKESADALQADKLYLTDAIADISHQLRTPLTSMNLTVSLLTVEDLPNEKRLLLTRELNRSLRRIDWLIEALLKMSKIDAGTVRFKKEDVSVKQLIQKAIEPLAITMELKDQALHVTVEDESFSGDMAWCVEALGNVVKNCVEHTPSGGKIEIMASETTIYTEIIVHDNGMGFDSADVPHLFERFYKGKTASAESIGIGLALARMVITQQNGTIQASNGKNGGAKFVIRFYKGIV